MPANAYERGQRAKRKGRLLEQNPFAKRKQTRGNVQRANDWALGWHSVEALAAPPSDWKWPPLQPYPYPEAGDYGVRERGLLKMMRPKDLVEYDVLRHQMAYGATDYVVPLWAFLPYGILWHHAEQKGVEIGPHPVAALSYHTIEEVLRQSHPLKFLWSAFHFSGGGAHWPPLVTSAYEELMHGSVFEVLPPEHDARSARERPWLGSGWDGDLEPAEAGADPEQPEHVDAD